MVLKPLDNIDQDKQPFFSPKLEDEEKSLGSRWFKMLPLIVDPANMFVHISNVEIDPSLARTFVKEIPASNKYVNDTYLFEINANDAEEKVGNVSFFVEVSAFNNK